MAFKIYYGAPDGRLTSASHSCEMGGRMDKEKRDEHQDNKTQENGTESVAEGLGSLYKHDHNRKKKLHPCKHLLKIIYVVFGIVTALIALALLVISVITAVATKIFTHEQSGHLVAMVLLAISAAGCITTTIYSSIAVFKKHGGFKSLIMASVVLILLALVQAIISGVSLKVTVQDELEIATAMDESFQLAYVHKSAKHEKLWSTVQHELDCCGVQSAEDYREYNQNPLFYSPNVPISCCPNYDPTRSPASQENSREQCRNRKTYHNVGCRNLVIELLKSTTGSVLGVTILLIIFEVVGATIIAVIISKKRKKSQHKEKSTEPNRTSVVNLYGDPQ